MLNFSNFTLKGVKKLIIGVIGGTVLLIGVAMIVLPGPAFIVIPIGLAILAREFFWAKKLLKKVSSLIKSSENKENNEKEKAPEEKTILIPEIPKPPLKNSDHTEH